MLFFSPVSANLINCFSFLKMKSKYCILLQNPDNIHLFMENCNNYNLMSNFIKIKVFLFHHESVFKFFLSFRPPREKATILMYKPTQPIFLSIQTDSKLVVPEFPNRYNEEILMLIISLPILC